MSTGHSATVTLGYGGAGVYPQEASANSERYFRVQVVLGQNESLASLRILNGVTGQSWLVQAGTPLTVQDGVTAYPGASTGGPSTTVWTIGPFAGYDITGQPHGTTDDVIGNLTGYYGNGAPFTIRAVTVSGTTATTTDLTSTQYTQSDNADILEWYSGDAFGVDPLAVDGPVPGADVGSSSNVFTFRVQYKIPSWFQRNLMPRWGTPSAPPGPRGNFADFDLGRTNAFRHDDREYDWWIYSPGRHQFPQESSDNTPCYDDFTDQVGTVVQHDDAGPEVVLIIDGDRTRPHFMQREDRNDTNARDSNGIRYFYKLLPMDFANFMDNLFLSPYDPPEDDPQDVISSTVYGKPVSNNYVAMQVGKHTYEFMATDDFSPPGNHQAVGVPTTGSNCAWVQAGQPGNGEYNDYVQPTLSGKGQIVSARHSRRFADNDGAAGGYGYPFDSQSGQYPIINPMLTAHPYFPRGTVTPGAFGAELNVDPPGAALDPFSKEVGAGPNPPVRVTNDDTILPNFANIWSNTATTPHRPFQGGKWMASSNYTFRINYWQSANVPPEYIRVQVRKVVNGTPGAWRGYTLEKANPGDISYTDGCIYQHVIAPDQMPDGGGAGDYQYYFVAKDGTREAIFPNRPARDGYRFTIDDPGDLGIASAPDGLNDYYAFRVNQPPTLTNQSVTPSIATAGTSYQFGVTYTDLDGEMLNALPQGDRPFETSIYVDQFGSPKGQATVQMVQNDTTMTYRTTSGTGYATNDLAGYDVEITTTNAGARTYRIASNTTNTIVLATGTRLLTDGVAAGTQFRISHWFPGTMEPADLTDTNYADGKRYVFDTATHMVLGPGVHRYYFVFRDDWGSWVTTDTNVRVEGEQVRYPFTGEFEGPEVIENTPPILVDYRFTPDSTGTAPDGTTATPFVFSVTYKDEENNAPSLIRLGVDGTADAPELILNMTQDDPSDTVYTDGAIFKTQPVKLTQGQHIFRAQASDGTGRYPNVPAGQTFTFAPMPTTTINDYEPGPLVTSNKAPTLSFETIDAVETASPGLSPDSGRSTTEFVYRIIYTDLDRFAGVAGNPPDYVKVAIDGTEWTMEQVDKTDRDYTDGAIFQYTTKDAPLAVGFPHRYWFVASDGLDRARRPETGHTPSYYKGPIVDEPPSAPLSLTAMDHPNDNGGVIDLQFNASQDDGGGADDVIGYRIYRSLDPASFPTPALLTIPANGSPTYTVQDTTATTNVEYYYIVRAYDISGESADSNREGPVMALDTISPEPPSNLTVTDPGAGGTLNLSWNLSPDDGGGQNDVKEYRIYRRVAGGEYALVATVAKGTTTYSDKSVVDGTQYWYIMRAYDGANESTATPEVGPRQSTDRADPVISDVDPANRAVAPRDTHISFVVSDTGTGVDRDTIGLNINGTDIANNALTITGNTASFNVRYQPATFDYRQNVVVIATAADLGGRTATKTWRFSITGPDTYTISGHIADSSGTAKQGVVVSAGALTGTTDQFGNYAIHGLVEETYTVAPVLRGIAFTPREREIPVSADVSDVDFVWEPGFSITGSITDASADPMPGVTVTAGSLTAITDSLGRYAFRDIPADTYTVRPSLPQYMFAPASRSVTVGPSASSVTFRGQLETWTVSGTITDTSGHRMSGVRVEASGGGPTAVATTNSDGFYTVQGLVPGQWTITPSKDGYEFNPDSQVVDVQAGVTGTDFVGVPIYDVAVGSGLTFIALPVEPEDNKPLSVFGSLATYRWDPTGTNTENGRAGYVAAQNRPNSAFMQVRPGRGFWVRGSVATTLAVPGTPVPNTQTTYLQLNDGWNMVGNPYTANLPWANVGVTAGGPVRDFGYIYDRSTGSYRLVTELPGLGAVTEVPKNAGFWMRSTGARSVSVTPVSSTASSRQTVWTRSAGEFVIPIVARAGDRADLSARAGVVSYAADHSDDYLVDNPPAMGDYVDVYFPASDGRLLSCDIRGQSANSLSYKFVVNTNLTNTVVKVSLPDLSQVPRDKSIVLVDVASGKRLWARTMSAYSYNSGEGGAREFRLEIGTSANAGLAVTLAPAEARTGAVALTYTLSKPANVQISIMNLAGRVIRVLTPGAVATAGVNSAMWDLRSQSGSKVPAGRYLVTVKASGDDGQQVSAVAPLQVR
ncbi:MAG: carboxypeptidase regulatory-like domain-containing protein [Armatimonadia bacterium]